MVGDGWWLGERTTLAGSCFPDKQRPRPTGVLGIKGLWAAAGLIRLPLTKLPSVASVRRSGREMKGIMTEVQSACVTNELATPSLMQPPASCYPDRLSGPSPDCSLHAEKAPHQHHGNPDSMRKASIVPSLWDIVTLISTPWYSGHFAFPGSKFAGGNKYSEPHL